jgi:hypothetical protein
MSKRAQILEFIEANPKMKVKDIAANLKCSTVSVYAARRSSGLTARDKEVKRLQNELATANAVNKKLHAEIEKGTGSTGGRDWKSEYDHAVLHIKNIERILGEHKVVIGYLEHQLFRSGQEHGASV